MVRLMVYCEGETEEAFINEVLVPVLSDLGIYTSAHSCKGVSRYAKIRKDLRNFCRNYRDGYVTMMLDYYGIPSDTPGVTESKGDVYEKVRHVENMIKDDIGEPNLIPNLMLHEFEALLFSDPRYFSEVIENRGAVDKLIRIRGDYCTPEHINDNPNTSPSKRILGVYREYSKPIDGLYIAKCIGLDIMRKECRHFDGWLSTIESLQSIQ